MVTEQAGTEVPDDVKDDIESWLSEATPDEVRVSICMNRSLLADFDAVIAEYEAYRPRETGIAMLDGDAPEDDPKLEELQNRVVFLRKAIAEDEQKHTFVFRKIHYLEWRKILEGFPPTKAQVERYRGMIDHDVEGAAPSMVASSCVSPKMTIAQAEQLRTILPENVWSKLYTAAIRVNRTGTELPNSVLRTVDQLDTELRSISRVGQDSPSHASADASRKREKQSGRQRTSK